MIRLFEVVLMRFQRAPNQGRNLLLRRERVGCRADWFPMLNGNAYIQTSHNEQKCFCFRGYSLILNHNMHRYWFLQQVLISSILIDYFKIYAHLWLLVNVQTVDIDWWSYVGYCLDCWSTIPVYVHLQSHDLGASRCCWDRVHVTKIDLEKCLRKRTQLEQTEGSIQWGDIRLGIIGV